ADPGGAARQLKTFERSWQAMGNPVEQGGHVLAGARSRRVSFLAIPFCGFDLLPISEHFGSILRVRFAEDVRVAAHHFVVDLANHVGDGKTVFFAGNLRMEDYLEE